VLSRNMDTGRDASVDLYKMLSNNMPIDKELYKLRFRLMKDELETNSNKKIPLATAFQLECETAEGEDEIVEAAVKSENQ
jgi:hypothetical protein